MRLVLPMLAVWSLGFAPVPLPRPDPAKEDLKRLQGAWVLAFSVKNGLREDQSQKGVWRIEGNRITTMLDGRKITTVSIVLDARTTPRSIDIISSASGGARVPGRYSVEGDTLKVCLGAKRPADLSGNGTSNGVWVFKRVKR
jgi:uncharacterized protein (TIGR03067 family)